VRKWTQIAVVALFLILLAAAIYQVTLGNRSGELQGPTTPNQLPSLSTGP
jgi:hypothetical protein